LARHSVVHSTIVLVAFILWATSAFAETGGNECFRRGVAIHNMMNWATVRDTEPKQYIVPAFVGPAYETPDALLRNVAAAGFDFIRLTIDPGPFLQFSGADREGLDRHLVAVVERFLSHGFCVIVDFHPNDQVAEYAAERLVRSIEDPVFHAYVGLVKRTAGLLAGFQTDRVALELMNEPQYGWDQTTAERWQRMLEQLHGAARSAATNLLIVLTGARGGDDKGLIAVDPRPFAGSRVLFSFHYYKPYEFTHQGVKSAQPSAWTWQFISGLPYPAQAGDPDRVWHGIEQNILADNALDPAGKRRALRDVRERVASYIAGGFSRKDVAADFDVVADWAKRYRIDPHSILLGEFGVTRTYGNYRASDPASQEAWMRDVRSEAERRGFRWALWALSGYGGMALVEKDGSAALDPVSLRALGLSGGY
jgi:endoglucanase